MTPTKPAASHELVLFHSALGRRPAVHAFADRLRAAGHTVHTPDLFDGEVFDDLDAGVRKRDAIGIPGLIGRAQAAVAALPANLVYAGFSMGAGAAAFLAGTRPGARGAVLMHGTIPPAAWGGEGWPPGVPVQVHYAGEDPWVEATMVASLEAAVRAAGARWEAHVYPGAGHLFADDGAPEYDAAAAASMLHRVLGFVAGA